MLLRGRFGASAAGAIVAVALGIVGATAALLDTFDVWAPPAWLPRAMFLAAVGVAALVLGVLAHALLRRDATRGERLVLALLVLALPGVGGFAYLALGDERTRAFARRVLLMLEPLRVSGGAA